jgi:hypothetical protein
MTEKTLEFIGSDGLPDTMHVRIDMDMPYDLALKILDLIEKEMPEDFGATEEERTD